jgi:hypothetical protein
MKLFPLCISLLILSDPVPSLAQGPGFESTHSIDSSDLPQATTAQAITQATLAQATIAQASALPPSIATTVLQTHANNFNRPQYLFRISEATSQNWPDACLGLAEAYEFCNQAIVPGWRIVVSDGEDQWVYRSDASGLTLRRELGTRSVNQGNQPNANGWETQLRWSKVTDSDVPALVYQLAVLRKPQTTYASAVYQFYARQRGETNWTYFHTTLGARLIWDGAAAFDLPLEMTELNQFDTTLGESYDWSDAEIKVAVLLRYDVSPSQRDVRLRFEHEQPYQTIAPISLSQLTIEPVTSYPAANPAFANPTVTNPVPANPAFTNSPGINLPVSNSANTRPTGVPVLAPLATPLPRYAPVASRLITLRDSIDG